MNHKLLILPLTPGNLADAVSLMEEYGNYMYHQLALTSGKEKFYAELGNKVLDAYHPPHGSFFIAYCDGAPAGCAALKQWDKQTAELKRMFVRPQFRRRGIGKLLTQHAISTAPQLGFTELLLDTNAEMIAAVSLYSNMGFQTAPPYVYNENPNVIYMEKML